MRMGIAHQRDHDLVLRANNITLSQALAGKLIGQRLAALNDHVTRAFNIDVGAANGNVAVAAHDDFGRTGLQSDPVLRL